MGVDDRLTDGGDQPTSHDDDDGREGRQETKTRDRTAPTDGEGALRWEENAGGLFRNV